MITIKEIANTLGLSTTTVSNVIHGKTKEVSRETIEQVKTILEEYEYVPNINARNLAKNNSKIIGIALKSRKKHFVGKNYIKDAFTSELVGAVERAVNDAGYFLMIYISDDIAETLSYISTWNVDGLIVLGMMDEDCARIKEKYKKAVVFVDSYFYKEAGEFCNVGLEDEKGSYQITKYVISQGHKKIAFVSDVCVAVEAMRYAGYQKAMKEAGLEYSDEDFIYIDEEEVKSEETDKTGLQSILEACKKYTAFICSTDFHASAVISYLYDHGIKVPEAVSVTGFDDNYYSKFVRPKLTTIHQDPEQKGRIAVEMLMQQISGKEPEKKIVILPIELKIRDSVKRIL